MSRSRYPDTDGNRLIRDVSPRVCSIIFFLFVLCLQQYLVKIWNSTPVWTLLCPVLPEHYVTESSFLRILSRYSRWNRSLWVWMIRCSAPQRSSAAFFLYTPYTRSDPWWNLSLICARVVTRTVPNSLRPSNQRNVRHFSSNLYIQLWLKSQVPSLVIRSPWNRLVDTVSSLFVCHVASSLRTLVMFRFFTMITSMHLTLDAKSSCVGIAILSREVALLVVLVFPRHVYIFEVRIDWLSATVMQSKYFSLFHLS